MEFPADKWLVSVLDRREGDASTGQGKESEEKVVKGRRMRCVTRTAVLCGGCGLIDESCGGSGEGRRGLAAIRSISLTIGAVGYLSEVEACATRDSAQECRRVRWRQRWRYRTGSN